MIQFMCLKDTMDAIRKMDYGGTGIEKRKLNFGNLESENGG